VRGGEGQGARVFYIILTTRGREVVSGVSAKEPRGAREQSRLASAAASEISNFQYHLKRTTGTPFFIDHNS
jgi:hypothetical protein